MSHHHVPDVLGDTDATATLLSEVFGRAPAPSHRWTFDAVPFDNMTTAALAHVRGPFADESGEQWSIFLKAVQPVSRSPLFELIPDQLRAVALKELPWRAEPNLYRSELAHYLPIGLRLPAIYRFEEAEDERIVMWMEDVPTRGSAWNLDDYERAARLLGRLAGRLPEKAIPGGLPASTRTLRTYFSGRIAQFVLPRLHDDDTWRHPLIARCVDDGLRHDLLALASAMPALLDRLDDLPKSFAHGDACPQNLLPERVDPNRLVAIDWSYGGVHAIGYDLGQLLAGGAESGELDAAQLTAVHATILPAYLAGLEDEGARADVSAVTVGYVGSLVVRSAFTSLPLEHLDKSD